MLHYDGSFFPLLLSHLVATGDAFCSLSCRLNRKQARYRKSPRSKIWHLLSTILLQISYSKISCLLYRTTEDKRDFFLIYLYYVRSKSTSKYSFTVLNPVLSSKLVSSSEKSENVKQVFGLVDSSSTMNQEAPTSRNLLYRSQISIPTHASVLFSYPNFVKHSLCMCIKSVVRNFK